MIQSYILISDSKKKSEVFFKKLCDTYKIHPLDVTFIENESSSFGIKEIRKLQNSLHLTPFKSDCKLVILPSSELLTIPAQHALLKTLEEPPNNTIIILVAKAKNIFLPTILSRCSIVELSTNEPSDNLSSEYLMNVLKDSPGQRLKLAQELSKNKEEAIEWVTKTIRAVRSELLNQQKSGEKENTDRNLQLLSQLQETHRILTKTNVNLRLHLENLFLSF